MQPRPPLQHARRLCDWTPEAGPLEDWLERWAQAGWSPEYGQGVQTDVGGRSIERWAMIRTRANRA